MAVDTNNAQIRPDVSGRAANIEADEAARFLRDPAFVRGFDAVQSAIIHELAMLKHDGQDTTDAFERELCRSLRTLHCLRRAITLGVQKQKLRSVDFRPQQD